MRQSNSHTLTKLTLHVAVLLCCAQDLAFGKLFTDHMLLVSVHGWEFCVEGG